MGFTPQQVDAMSLWQFGACIDGWNRSQGGDEDVDPPTAEEFEDMVRRLG
jgi:hypothetical protein